MLAIMTLLEEALHGVELISISSLTLVYTWIEWDILVN